ncbi:MAG: bifunctional riboflavin kinase/FAD synthetase, partial [Eubacterium sp.]|nr:bifunctional riboflavin kinase/FAD synthetase [Eubacterium sp.]
MIHYKDIAQLQAERPCVVTLGKFDGVHRGHRKLLARVREIACRQNMDAAVFTFSVSPQVKLKKRTGGLLMTNAERAGYLRMQEIGLLVECPFTDEIRNMSAEAFVEEILVRKMKAGYIVVGSDFRFGKNRAGSAAYLQEC